MTECVQDKIRENYEELENTYIDYVLTRDKFKSESLNRDCEKIVRDTLFQDPYVELINQYKSTGNTVEKDISNDLEEQDLYDLISIEKTGLFPKDNNKISLYTHQKDALFYAKQGKHVVVTSGTGSGKTESFLLPVLANILNEAKKWENRGEIPQKPYKSISNMEMTYPYQRHGEKRAHAIRTLIMYPLNALVEDQLVRLRKTLDSDEAKRIIKEKTHGNLIYFGRYNSSTPIPGERPGDNIDTKITNEEKEKRKNLYKEIKALEAIQDSEFRNEDGKPAEEARFLIQNLDGSEMYSRWDMQKYPPDIFVTNYSMLNVMMMRKVEDNIFDATKEWLKKDKNNKFQLVLDELHSYRGTQGTEIAYLIRTLLDRLDLNPDSPQLQIIATSASLGTKEESLNFLQQFFGCNDTSKFEIITGDIITPQETKGDENLKKLREMFYDGEKYIAKSLSDLEKKHFYEIKTNNNNFRLRAHYFFKNFKGIWACSNPNCTEIHGIDEEERKKRKVGKLYSEPQAMCKCGGRILELLICQQCGDVLLGGYHDEKAVKKLESSKEDIYLFPQYYDYEKMPNALDTERITKNYLVLIPNPEEDAVEANNYINDLDYKPKGAVTNKIWKWKKAKYNCFKGTICSAGKRGEFNSAYYIIEGDNTISTPIECPYCDTKWEPKPNEEIKYTVIKPIIYGFQKINQILADKLLYIQSRGIEEENKKKSKLVIFTDSRQDAAKLSAGIEMDHFRDTLRQIMYQSLQERKENESQKDNDDKYFIELCEKKYKDKCINEKEDEDRKKLKKSNSDRSNIDAYYRDDEDLTYEDKEEIKNKIKTIKSQTFNITKPCPFNELQDNVYKKMLELGINPGSYKFNKYGEKEDKNWFDCYKWSNNKFKGDSKSNTDISQFKGIVEDQNKLELLKTLFYKSRGIEALGIGIITYNQDKYKLDNKKKQAINSAIRIMGQQNRFDVSNRTKTKKEGSFLNDYSKFIFPEEDKFYLYNLMKDLDLIDDNNFLKTEDLYIELKDDMDNMYYCPKCQMIYVNPSNEKCINKNCKGKKLEVLTNDKFDKKHNFYLNLINNIPKKLTCEELTAQTNKEEQRNRQRIFQNVYKYKTDKYTTNNEENTLSGNECDIKDSIEILSVTTTMEAGVDIGSLDSVLMANMPPERFNYQQRVGRAGRRGKPLATALTICRNRNHDNYYFNYPNKITNDPPKPPYLDTERESIIQRFLNKEVLRLIYRELKDSYATRYVHGDFGTPEEWADDKIYVQEWIKKNKDKIEQIADVLLKESKFNNKGKLINYIQNDLVGTIDKAVIEYGIEFDESLSELLANAGILPMFGFPTRTRDLIIEFDCDQSIKDSINRDLDIALSQFIPKGETVRDKKIHMSVGVVSGKIPQNADDEGKTRDFWVCPNCKNLTEINQQNNKETHICEVCNYENDIKTKTIQPENFFTPQAADYSCKPIYYDGNFDYAPYSEKPQINHSDDIILRTSERNNYKYLPETQFMQVVAINDNKGNNYKVTKIMDNPKKKVMNHCIDEKFWVVDEAVEKYNKKSKEANQYLKYEPRINNEYESTEIAFISSKKTDIFLAEISNIPNIIDLSVVNKYGENIYSKIAYYSLAFLLRDAASNILDINKREISVGLRPVNNGEIVTNQIFLSDTLDNGAGYSKWLCNEKNFIDVLKSIADKNGDFYISLTNHNHIEKCDNSCYECMQSYDNLHYHGLLNWRLGLDMARMMYDKTFVPSLKENYWVNLKEKADKNLNELCQIVKKENDFNIIHPLYKSDEDKDINIFDLLFRPEEVVKQLNGTSDRNAKIILSYNEQDSTTHERENNSDVISNIINLYDFEENDINTINLLKIKGLDYIDEYETLAEDANLTNKQNGSIVHADLIWNNNKILLFFTDNQVEYEKAKDSNWKCFILNEQFNINEFEICFNRR